MPELEIAKVLVVSTGHVSKDEAELWNDDQGVGDDGQWSRGWARDWGWMLYLGMEKDTEDEFAGVSEGLRGVIETARLADCIWIMFDCDGPTIEGIPTYDW